MKKILLILIGLSMILLGDLSRSNGVITDSVTLLEWQDNDTYEGGYRDETWRDAIYDCENLELDGGGWRLPNINELVSLVDDTQIYPTISSVFQYVALFSPYWSSSTYLLGNTAAWCMDFNVGNQLYLDKNDEHSVRCVRGGR